MTEQKKGRAGHLANRQRERLDHLKIEEEIKEEKPKKEYGTLRAYQKDYDFIDDIKRANKEFKNMSDAIEHIIEVYKDSIKSNK